MALYNVLFDIAARTAKFEEAMTRVDRRLDNMQRGALRISKSLGTIFGAGLFAKFTADAAAAGDEMLNLAERTGRSVESVSQLDYVAKRANTTVEAIAKSQDQLAKRLGATDEEGKAAAKALKELGLSGDRLRSLSLDEQLNVIADAMGSVTDPTKRARLEMALLGKTGTEMDAILRSGAGGIRELRDEADKLGLTVTDLEAKRLRALDDQLEATKGQFNRLKLEIAGILAQPLAWYFDLVTKGVQGWRVMLGVTGDQLEETNSQISTLQQEMKKLRDESVHGGFGATKEGQARIEQIKEELELLRQKQEQLLEQPAAMARYEAMDAANRAKANARAEEAAKKAEAEAEALKKRTKALAEWRKELDELVAQEKRMNELEVKFPTGLLSKDELRSTLDQTGAMVEKSAKDFDKVVDKLGAETKKSFGGSWEEISKMAERGLENIQDALADFLFDPFEKGLDGMLAGFINVLRRMVAEAASAQILKAIGFGQPGGGGFGGFIGGIVGAITGGSIGGAAGSAGAAAMTAIAGGSSPLSASSASSSMVFAPQTTIHVDSRVDRSAVMQDVAAIVDANNRRFAEQLADSRSRGR